MTDSSDTIHVLHVDDDPRFTDTVATFLEREAGDLNLSAAADAREGLERLAERDVDCVVSDYALPEMDGIEFLEAVRADHADLPFVLFTGKGSEEVASEAISAGVTDYLQKDVGTDQYALLANRIRNAVEGHRAAQQATEESRVNAVVRRINAELARASTRAEIDERVCTVLTDTDPYRFAWIGVHAPESETIEPRATAGLSDDYLDAIEVRTDETLTGQGPTGRALRTGAVAVAQNIPEDPAYEPWREAALDRGYRSSAAVPLEYDGRRHGVLNLYADRPNAFDERERRLLDTLGETIAHAYHRVELQHQYTEQYATLFEDAPVMLVSTRDVGGEPIIEDCNRAFADRLGYTPEAVRETSLLDYYTEAAAEALVDGGGFERAKRGTFVREQRTLLTRDGEEVLAVLRASPRRDRTGEIVGTHALYLDITNEQQVRDLERTNALLSTLFDALPQGIIAEDESRNVLAVNEQTFDLWDLSGSPEDLVGTDCSQLSESVGETVVDSEAFAERIEDLVASRDPVSGEEFALTDGRTFERSYRPIELAAGDGNLWVYDDVSDRVERRRRIRGFQRRTEELIASREESEIAAAAVAIAEETLEFPLSGVHLVDDDREQLEPVAVTDAVRDHLGGEPVYDRADPSRSPDVNNWDVFERGEPVVIEDVREYDGLDPGDTPSRSGIIHPLGDHGLFVTSSPEPNAFDEADLHFVEILAAVVTAVLDRAAREAELREQTERLDEFASVVSHDLRNPLSVASGYLDLAREEYDSAHLDEVARAHDRMETLIEDLLTLARTGDTTVDTDPIDLGTLVDDCWATVETDGTTLVSEADRRIRADESRLKQVLENLIRNSVEHGGRDVTVTVGDLPDGFYLEDDGPGIPDGDRERIFDMGYSNSEEGTGFGLSIVAEIVAAHDWEIRATEGTEGGARFEITGVDPVEE